MKPTEAEAIEECTYFLGNIHLPDVSWNDALEPLHKLRRIDGSLTFFRNHVLTNLRGLENLASIGGELSIRLDFSDQFASVDGMSSLCDVGELTIHSVHALRSLDGLSALQQVRGDVTITDNPQLSSTQVLQFLAGIEVEGTIEADGNGE